ncbi:hypothetical protein [Nibricoccus sp. IMCC34717]|uniref:hypothetical protein n=1 Tax=Nibricoccus sp. IMCC34717 TaxID=3034021 RepID=UPI00384D32E3
MKQETFPFSREPSPGSSLTPKIQKAHARQKLTKKQKRFNQLVGEVDRLQATIKLRKEQIQSDLIRYQKEIAPLLRVLEVERRLVVLELSRFRASGAKLGPKQREQLDHYLLDEVMHISRIAPELINQALADLHKTVLETLRAREEKRHGTQRADTEERAAGKDGEPTPEDDKDWDFTDDDWTEGIGAEATNAEEQADQAKEEEAERAREELRSRHISTLYKRLARIFHPDLEPDPVRKAEKHVLMQRLTEANANGDVHTLLSLEIEYIHGASDALAELDEEKLSLFCETLEGQKEELQEERHSLEFDERHQAIRPFLPALTDLQEKRYLGRALIDEVSMLRATLRGLRGPESAKWVRDTLQRRKMFSLLDMLAAFQA